ncbi:Crp/Fnr family transcriptional regulator [Aquaspirillum sp. LM1]|jgi:CRP-like cAMP-binding protein|uniref:Crp/Fnr family transcriptional regulator n=1 Tax=Aquaspirillum sp. LM1 TaxID=1938604 RepID=UPI0009838DF9|nr:Crp/Fnr family transcriptional regulator [Aquaspirillum sp. LM1]AQR66243.1 Crp/Fnr family transcriptional regulator [Aquaspirillum sp. LM1]
MHPCHPHAPDLATLAQSDQPAGWLTGFVARDYPKGYLLASPGERRDQVFVVKSGRLRVYLAGENRDLSLSFLEAGDVYTTHTPTYVETVTPSVLWCIDTADFARQLAVDPSFTPVMMRVLGRLLRNAVTLIDDLAFREVPARLARFLLGLVDRRGQPHPQGWLIPLELGTEDIASLLGSTRQTVSLLLNQWVRDGILARPGRRQLLVLSRQALADLSAS